MTTHKKKSSKRNASKQPKRITGLEASLLSFRARHGKAPFEWVEFELPISPHVRKILLAKKKSKAGAKTLGEIRKVAQANRERITNTSKKSRDSNFRASSTQA